MVEKAVQTLQVEKSWQGRGFIAPQEQEQHWDRRRPQRTRGEVSQTRGSTRATSKHADL